MRNVRSGRRPLVARRLSSSPLDAQAAGEALVCQRGIQVAVGDNVGPACERRTDHLVDELRAGCGEERRLRPGRHPLAVQEDSAHVLPELGAPRLACQNDFAAL